MVAQSVTDVGGCRSTIARRQSGCEARRHVGSLGSCAGSSPNMFSFGSMQGLAHVHWHLAPLPPGIPFREQQVAAVGKLEYLVLAEAERDELAARVGAGMTALSE